MKGKKHRHARAVEDPGNKINPQVIRQLLFEIVEEEFEGDRGAAANSLKLKNPIKGNYYPFTKDIISNLIDDRTAFKYVHLEALANYYNLPTFMFLLFSRLRSEDENFPGIDVNEVLEVKHVISFLTDIETSINDCSFRAWDLKVWSKKYHEKRQYELTLVNKFESP